MKTGRRGFLGMLGGGMLAGPKGAANLAKDVYSGGVGSINNGTGGFILGGGTQLTALTELSKAPPEFVGPLGLLHYVNKHGVPEHLRESWKQEAKTVTILDQDLADNRSMSAVAKIYLQRQRNYSRIEQNNLDPVVKNLREKFYEKHPWASSLFGF